MCSYSLEKYNLSELKKMAEKMGIPARRGKNEMMADISKAFSEYEEYKKEKIDRYERKQQLGEKGKEGTTYLILDKKGKEYAMKTFRSGKSSSTLKKEYSLQKKAYKAGVAPKVYDYDTVGKWILMEKMDSHLYDRMVAKGLRKSDQERIIEIFQKLDNAEVFHNDANLYNYMEKNGKIYLIDYGFSKEITPKLKKKLKTETPNYTLMLIGFIMKLKELKLPERSYKLLLKHVSQENKERYLK